MKIPRKLSVELPTELHEMLRRSAKANRRTLTGETILAIEKHLQLPAANDTASSKPAQVHQSPEGQEGV